LPRRSRPTLFNLILRLVTLLALLAALAFLFFWLRLPPAQRYDLSLLALIVMAFSAVVAALLVVIFLRLRALAWQRAMLPAGGARPGGFIPAHDSVRSFSPAQLETFTARLFQQMGYRVNHTGQTGDHGVDVRLLNPHGQVELVQCKQWNKPVGEPEVRDLAGAMLHEQAVRGYLVAPAGFSSAARQWARGKSIMLVDEREIARLVQRAYR